MLKYFKLKYFLHMHRQLLYKYSINKVADASFIYCADLSNVNNIFVLSLLVYHDVHERM